MKSLITILTTTLFTLAMSAQSFVENNYENLIDADESTVVKVNQSTFKYASAFVEDTEPEDEIDAKEMLDNIEYFILVAMEDMEDARGTYRKGLRNLESGYEELVNVKSKEGNFTIQVNESGGIVYEIVSLGTDGDDFMAGSVLCEVKLEDVGKIINNIEIDNWKSFKEANNIDYESLSVYPNPVSSSGDLSIEIPDQLVGGKLAILDANGASVKVLKADTNEKNISTAGLNAGSYLISISKGDITINRRVLVVE